jgi:DNA-binding Lrp family transcriptional regulator
LRHVASVDQLVEDDVIERFTISTQTGNVKAMVEIGIDVNAKTDGLTDRLADCDEVDFVWHVSGEEDIVLVIDAADTSSLNDLITQARELEEVESTKTRLILDEWLG